MNFRVITEDEFKELNRFVVPPSIARAGWAFDKELCVWAVKEVLKLKYPVHMRYIRGRRRLGTHYAREKQHRITLSQDRIIEVANETLWHELMHAKQSEEWERASGKSQTTFYREAYMPANGEWGMSYEHNAYELECNEFADENKHIMLLKKVRP